MSRSILSAVRVFAITNLKYSINCYFELENFLKIVLESTQKVDIYLVSNYWQTGAADVAALSIRSTVAEAKTFAEQYRKIYKVYGLSIGKTDYNQVMKPFQCLFIRCFENSAENTLMYS